MKKRIYFYITVFLSLTALFLWNCTDTIGFNLYGEQKAHEDFTIEEAKAFFEKQYSRNMPISRSIEEKGNKRLTPGEFVPLWDKAVPSAKGRLECYDIPIKNDIHYKAIYSTYENGKARAYAVNVYQKLVVVKNKNNGNMGTYILNLIPDAKYDKKYLKKVGDRFINCADKGGFSGIAFYTMPNLNMILRVNYYKNGVKKRGVFLSGKKEELEEKMRIAYSIIGSVLVKGKKKVSTRSYGEDGWWDDGWWEDEDWNNWEDGGWNNWEDGGWESDSGFIEIGDSLWYVDENGNAFIMKDFDGDGIPETPTTPDVVIEPDEGDDEDWWPEEDTEEEIPLFPDNEDPDSETDYVGDNGGYMPDEDNKKEENKNVNKEYTPKETDVIADNNLLKMDRKEQKGNTCVPTIMEYILKNNGSKLDRDDIIKFYENQLSENGHKYKVHRDGVPANAVPAGVVSFFGSDAIAGSQYGGDPPYDYKSAIDRGNVVMTNVFMEVDGNKIGHNILIVGYTEEGNYIYIDPNYSDKEFECSPDYLETKNASKYDFEIIKK